MHDNLKTPEEIATWMRASKTEREYEAKTGKTVSKGEKRAARNRAAKPSAPEPAETEPQFTAEQEKAEAVFLESLKSLLVESADQPKFLPADKVTHYSNVFGAEQLPAKQRMEAEAVFLESLKSLLVESADQPKFLPADKVTHYSNVFGAEQLPAKQRMEAGWELLD